MPDPLIWTGKASTFGGPDDTGVGDAEGLSCIDVSDLGTWWFRRIFLTPASWDNSKGLARNLDPNALYCAMRWGYGSFGGVAGEIAVGLTRAQVRASLIKLSANGKVVFLQPADWGPNTDTGRLIDCSPAGLSLLNCQTDDTVTAEIIPGF